MKNQDVLLSRKGQKCIEDKEELSQGERDLRKKVEIIIQVFKTSADRLSRVDREWQEVMDSQAYVLEEIIAK